MFTPKKLRTRFLLVTLFRPDVNCETGIELAQAPIGDDPMTIVGIHANVSTAGVDGVMTVDVNVDGTTIMVTDKLDIASAADADDDSAVISAPNVPARGVITFDVDAIHSTTVAKGLTVLLEILNV